MCHSAMRGQALEAEGIRESVSIAIYAMAIAV